MSMCRVEWQFPKSYLQALILASRRLKILESWKGFGQCIKASTTEEMDSNIRVPVWSYSLWPRAFVVVVVVQSLSRAQLFGTAWTAWTAACQASLSFTISQSLLRFMAIESVMPSNHLILYCSLLLLPSIFPSINVFSNELALGIRRPKYWRRFQYHSLKASVLWYSAFFMFQLSHLYMTTG